MTLGAILGTLAPVFGIMLLGAFAHRRRILPETSAHCLNLFVYWFSLPLLLFYQLARMRPEEVPPAAAWGYVLGLGVALIVVTAVLRLLRQGKKESLMLGLVGSFPNAAFMGMPVVLLLYPEHAGAALIASLAVVLTSLNLLLVDTVLDCTREGRVSKKGALWQALWQALGRVLRSLCHNPIMVCSALGVMVSVCGIALPETVFTISRMLGSTAAPCALFCMGMALSAQLASARPSALDNAVGESWAAKVLRQVPVHVGKLLLAPVLVFGLAFVLGQRGPTLVAAVVMAAMPSGVVANVLAEKYRAAAADTSWAILINTVLSALSLPLVIAVAQRAAG